MEREELFEQDSMTIAGLKGWAKNNHGREYSWSTPAYNFGDRAGSISRRVERHGFDLQKRQGGRIQAGIVIGTLNLRSWERCIAAPRHK